MNRGQFQRSPAKCGSGAARTPWLPHRIPGAAAPPHSIPVQCLRCAPDRARGAGIMTQLRIASQLVAVIAGAVAAFMLIDCQLIDFGVAAAICGGSSVAAGLIAYTGRRRGMAVARGRVAVWEGRDQQAAVAADEQCPLFGGARQTLNTSTKFVDRPGARHARLPSTQSRHDEPAPGLGASSDGYATRTVVPMGSEPRLGATWNRFQ
jgi:hypothetical protein